jgi:hypothetical protein
MIRRVLLSLAVSLPLAAAPAGAQDPAPAATSADAPRKAARAVRADGGVRLDGRLDEAVWAAAPAIADFVQKVPVEGAAPAERTEVRFAYDGEALYVGARMHASDPRSVQAPVSARDDGRQAEHLLVSLDTYLDRRTAYTFGVTAGGARLDWHHASDREGDQDASFQPVWEARVQRDAQGWTAEMRIPFSQLRFQRGEAQTWGVNVRRWAPSREEESYWVMVPARDAAWASRFGDLTGIEGVRPTRRIEVAPYASAGARLLADPGRGNPFTDGRDGELRVGGDLKMGLGPNLTLDATVNPDFGQVEADPAEVNLSAFETFFSERRPFFTEGSALLSSGGAGYFYSRRIGAAPHGFADGDFVDAPSSSTILGAAKLTGRLPSGLSVGALVAVTDRERATVADTAADATERVWVEPRTLYAVTRLEQQFGRAGSTAGFTLTAVGRDVEAGSDLAALLPRGAVTGGADAVLRLAGGTYELFGNAGFSHVRGDSAAILRLQRSSARYFQRPDADHVSLDPSRTSLAGYTAEAGLAKVQGRHWLWNAGVSAESPGFELNDAGSLSTADGLSFNGELRWRERTPGRVLRRYDLFVTPFAEWTYGGERTATQLWLDADLTFHNYWRTWLSFLWEPRTQSVSASRGGPLVGRGATRTFIALVQNSSSSTLRWSGRVYYGENEEGYPTMRLSGGVSARPGPRWSISVDPNYLHAVTARQYVGAFDGGPAATYGRRYVFAAVERDELRMPVRLSYLFTPDLSLDLYAEPFAARGRYHDFGDLPAAGAYDLDRYGGDTLRARKVDGVTTVFGPDGETRTARDFNRRSFRSNAVLRWEWRPGSTLHLVWQQDRFADLTDDRDVRPGALWQTLEAPGDNVLALKVTYWLPIR